MTRLMFNRVLPFVCGLLVVLFTLSVGLTSASAAPTEALARSAWRLEIAHLPVPKAGCFAGSYPALAWRSVTCRAAPRVPFAPPSSPEGQAPGPVQSIGNGSDYSAVVSSGSITTATGSFPYISPGSTEMGLPDGVGSTEAANTYSLQLNSEFFSGSPACDGASNPSACQAWQQFLYSSFGSLVYMQYWLIDYNTGCPSGWYTYPYRQDGQQITDCYENSDAVSFSGTPAVSAFEGVSLTGTAASDGEDSVVMSDGTNNVSAVGADSVVDLAGNWTTAEFDVFGDGNSSTASFSSGTALDVETTVNNGATSAPTCEAEGFTAETNNLGFASAPSLSAGSEPAIETQQTSSGGTGGCAAADGGADSVTVTDPGNQTSTVGTAVSLDLEGSDSASGQSFVWSASGLPSGISISSGGVISGLPTQAGTSSVTVRATDTTGATGTASFDWVVNPVPDLVTVRSPGNQTSTIGAAVSLDLEATDSASGQSLRWLATGLPSGLSISSGGLISGTPTQAETSSVTVGATDATGATGAATLSWVVNPAPDQVNVMSPGNQTSTVESAVSLHLKGVDSASGQRLTWSATGLPSGLSISSAGVISGKPTKTGTSSVTVKATDTTGAKGTATFSWVVKAAPHKVTVTNPGKKTTTVGSSVSLQLRGTDSVKGQTLKWSASKLPSGLSISSSGKITGKPKKAGTSTVTATAKDASGAKGTTKFTWVVKAR